MVYIEALFSGLPIVYTRGTGVDGYFEDYIVGLKVRPKEIKSLQHAILSIRERNEFHRREIRRMRRDGGFELFKSVNIVRSFDSAISNAKN